MYRCFAFMLLFSTAAFSSHLDGVQYGKPITTLASYDFSGGETLGIVSGVWQSSGGTFNSRSTATSIATIDSYLPEWNFNPPPTEIDASKFFFRARMLNERSGSNTRVGIVYLYQDSANFHEASFSPTGAVEIRDVVNGVSTTVATGTYTAGGQGSWFDAEVVWTAEETVILVNGFPVIQGVQQNARTSGRVGLITRQTTAKFDRVFASREYGDPEFTESFSEEVPAWPTVGGSWSAVNGVYQNSAVEHTNLTLLPIDIETDFPEVTESGTLRARMLNPYGASGNRMGIVFNYREVAGGVRFQEIVFGPDGVARHNSVGISATGSTGISALGTAPYAGERGEWFDVAFNIQALAGINQITVEVNDIPIFQEVQTETRGGLGLVTHWTPGQFDDVMFRHLDIGSTEETFDPTSPSAWWPWRGTWDDVGGVLNSRSVSQTDIAYTTYQHATDYALSVRMLNPYGASGNLIGVLFGLDLVAGDYYEVVFAPTGQAYLNKYIQGSKTQVAASTHSALGRNVWFTVELIRSGPYATVKVDGEVVFENVPAAQLDSIGIGRRIGLITHWAPGRFDDLSVKALR